MMMSETSATLCVRCENKAYKTVLVRALSETDSNKEKPVHFKYSGDKHFHPDKSFHHRITIPENCIHLKSYEKHVKALAIVEKRKTYIPNELSSALGTATSVHFEITNGRNKYMVKCPGIGCEYVGDRIEGHLVAAHKISNRIASFYKSRQVRMYNHITKIHQFGTKPLPCKLCARYFDRADSHCRGFHKIAKADMSSVIQSMRKFSNKLNKHFEFFVS